MNIISPLTISSFTTSLAVEDPTTVWASYTAVLGDYRHVVATHRVYKCAVAGSSTISPELDPTKWVDVRPTNKWAPFDIYTSTAATATTSLSYTLTYDNAATPSMGYDGGAVLSYAVAPGFFNATALYGLVGSQYALVVKDAPGGTVIFSRAGYLSEDPANWYEYLFGDLKQLTELIFSDIPIRPTAEMTVTLTGATVSVGMIVCGDMVSLAGDGAWGGAQYGASAEPVTYSYIKTTDDGTTSIIKRHAATNLNVSIMMPRAEADAVLKSVQGVLDVPVAWIATDAAGYAGLSTFGIGSGKMSYDSFGIATLSISVKGLT